jgi:hypothetical protein
MDPRLEWSLSSFQDPSAIMTAAITLKTTRAWVSPMITRIWRGRTGRCEGELEFGFWLEPNPY